MSLARALWREMRLNFQSRPLADCAKLYQLQRSRSQEGVQRPLEENTSGSPTAYELYCVVCEKIYTVRDGLKEHIKNIHEKIIHILPACLDRGVS